MIRRSMSAVVVTLIVLSVSRGDDTPSRQIPAVKTTAEELSIEGTWERTVESPNGKIRFEKQHANGDTRLTIYDAGGNVLQAKTSKYSLDLSGPVPIFTYFDNKIIAGQGAGQFGAEESSYVYRIEGDRFYEIRGILSAQREPFGVLVWGRVKTD